MSPLKPSPVVISITSISSSNLTPRRPNRSASSPCCSTPNTLCCNPNSRPPMPKPTEHPLSESLHPVLYNEARTSARARSKRWTRSLSPRLPVARASGRLLAALSARSVGSPLGSAPPLVAAPRPLLVSGAGPLASSGCRLLRSGRTGACAAVALRASAAALTRSPNPPWEQSLTSQGQAMEEAW